MTQESRPPNDSLPEAGVAGPKVGKTVVAGLEVGKIRAAQSDLQDQEF
jgi:hypothetical protein